MWLLRAKRHFWYHSVKIRRFNSPPPRSPKCWRAYSDRSRMFKRILSWLVNSCLVSTFFIPFPRIRTVSSQPPHLDRTFISLDTLFYECLLWSTQESINLPVSDHLDISPSHSLLSQNSPRSSKRKASYMDSPWTRLTFPFCLFLASLRSLPVWVPCHSFQDTAKFLSKFLNPLRCLTLAISYCLFHWLI